MPIDPANGDLLFPVGILPSSTSRRDFEHDPLFDLARPLIDNPPWMSWAFSGGYFEDEQILVQVYFEGSRLRLVNMVHSTEPPATTWDDWSTEKEIETKKRHDELCIKWLGEPTEAEANYLPGFGPPLRFEFPWGEVWSSYDPKSSSSAISIRYGPR